MRVVRLTVKLWPQKQMGTPPTTTTTNIIIYKAGVLMHTYSTDRHFCLVATSMLFILWGFVSSCNVLRTKWPICRILCWQKKKNGVPQKTDALLTFLGDDIIIQGITYPNPFSAALEYLHFHVQCRAIGYQQEERIQGTSPHNSNGQGEDCGTVN